MKQSNHALTKTDSQEQIKKKVRAVFQGDFRKHKTITTYICVNNDNQEGANFEAFIDLIIRENDTIKKLIIIDTSYLYRHYDAKFSDKDYSEWRAKHEQMLEKKFQGVNVVCEIQSWFDRVNTPEYQAAYAQVEKDFKNNKYNLQTVVSDNVKHYKHINGEEAATAYGLDELAEFTTQKGAVVFPGKLNGILRWGIKHYQIPISFIKYKFKDITIADTEDAVSDDSDESDYTTESLPKSSPPIQPVAANVTDSPRRNVAERQPQNSSISPGPISYYSGESAVAQGHSIFGQTVATYAEQLRLPTSKQFAFLAGFFSYCQQFVESEVGQEQAPTSHVPNVMSFVRRK